MLPQSHNDKAIWFVIFVILLFLVGSFVFVQYEIGQLKVGSSAIPSPVVQNNQQLPVSNDTCGPSCQAYINSAIENQLKVATSSSQSGSSTKTQIIYQQASTSPKVTYVPISSGSTQSTDWAEIAGTSFMLNIGDYGSKAYAIWDANLRVDNANGTTYARLFDKTHGIAVNGSEINVTGTSTSTDVTSLQLSFWQGNNSYVVQLKSLNGSTAFIDSGRIKISY